MGCDPRLSARLKTAVLAAVQRWRGSLNWAVTAAAPWVRVLAPIYRVGYVRFHDPSHTFARDRRPAGPGGATLGRRISFAARATKSMNVQRHSTSDEVDLDSTAELPVLDIAAAEARPAEERVGSTDTWIIPPPPTLRVASEIPETPSDPRSELETNLRALSANLGDVEDRLKRKVEQLAENERALESVRTERIGADQRADRLAKELSEARIAETAARAAIADLERSLQERAAKAEEAARRSAAESERSLRERAQSADVLRARDQQFTERYAEHERMLASLRLELNETRASATRYFESLQTLEGRRTLFDSIVSGLQSDIDAGEARIAGLERNLAARTSRVAELESELSLRAQRIATLEAQVNTFAASLAQRDEQLHQAESAGEELRRNVAALNDAVASGAALIHKLEVAAARQSETAAGRDSELARITRERDQFRGSVLSLEAAVSTATTLRDEQEKAARVAQSRCVELESQAAAQRKRAEQLETELTSVRTEMDQWGTALREATAERSEHVARVTAREERIKELEARIVEQQETVRTLQADSNASVARSKEIEADLRVAEEAIHRLESDLRTRIARVDELERTNHEWHVRVDEARSALTQKESLIQRLEEEAANSAVLIGQIQQSMKRLDPSLSGSHEAMPEGATRLLIRVDGDSEVVHVLGRKTSIGRTPDNDLQIDAKFISRHHAVILAGPARTIVEDLNSTNGVLVNGRRVTRQVLQDGDSVVVGRTQFRFAVRTPPSER